jgi:hypothetical protein
MNEQIRCRNCGRPLNTDERQNFFPFCYDYLNPAKQRAIRKESDKGVIVFIDDRFKEKMSWISEWVRKEIKIVSNLKKDIYEFWNK